MVVISLLPHCTNIQVNFLSQVKEGEIIQYRGTGNFTLVAHAGGYLNSHKLDLTE